jgi:hypothetical protein
MLVDGSQDFLFASTARVAEDAFITVLRAPLTWFLA